MVIMWLRRRADGGVAEGGVGGRGGQEGWESGNGGGLEGNPEGQWLHGQGGAWAAGREWEGREEPGRSPGSGFEPSGAT